MNSLAGYRITTCCNDVGTYGRNVPRVDPDDYIYRDPFIKVCLECPLPECEGERNGRPSAACPRDQLIKHARAGGAYRHGRLVSAVDGVHAAAASGAGAGRGEHPAPPVDGGAFPAGGAGFQPARKGR